MQQDVPPCIVPMWSSIHSRLHRLHRQSEPSPSQPVLWQPAVVLSGLPAGNWTINPGAIKGNTVSTTVSGLATGTYNFTVTNSVGCTSLASANVGINPQPATPAAPTVGAITQPTCAVATGSEYSADFLPVTGRSIPVPSTAIRYPPQ